jgi:hypothetical protein
MAENKNKSFMNTDNRINELVSERNIWIANKNGLKPINTHKTARKVMDASKSDPFAYSRSVTHLVNNIHVPEDYKSK